MDLVEEVALGYGINLLEPILSPSQTIGQTNPISLKLKSLGQIMIGLGYAEALNSSLSSKRILYDMTNRVICEVDHTADKAGVRKCRPGITCCHFKKFYRTNRPPTPVLEMKTKHKNKLSKNKGGWCKKNLRISNPSWQWATTAILYCFKIV